ncbi:hypothetical protein MTMBA_19310 [Moorella thermoacetica]
MYHLPGEGKSFLEGELIDANIVYFSGVAVMQIFSLLAIFFALLVAIFAVQNAGQVEINFLAWQFSNISLVLVILGSAAFGALVVFLLGAVRQVRQAREIRELKSQHKRLQETIARLELVAAGKGAGQQERKQEA